MRHLWLLWPLLTTCASQTKSPWHQDATSATLRNSPAHLKSSLSATPAEPTIVSVGESRTNEDFEPALIEPEADETYRMPQKLILRWPLAALGINSLFGKRHDPIAKNSRRYHHGIDLDAPYGSVVSAAAPGHVVQSGWNSGHGRQVVVEHANGWRTGYSHLSSVLVSDGDWVHAGQAIGLVGNSGRSTGPHLHFEVVKNGEYVDPLDILGESVALR